MSQDLYQAPDYFLLDELLTEEHKLIRDAAREWVKREVSPIIEEACQKAEFPKQIIKGLGEIGGFGPYIPIEYGGAGLDQISYGLIMQELERGDSNSFHLICTIFFGNVSNLEIWKRRTKNEIFTQTSDRRIYRLFWINRA